MDIPRPELARRRRRRQLLFAVAGVVLLSAATLGLSRLEPAAPTVAKAGVWTDTVKRGQMLRQVRGTGTLVPEQILFVLSDTDGRIERINVLPGTEVQADTVLMELSNPELEQDVFDMEWQLKAAEANLTKLLAQQESDRLAQKLKVVSLKADWGYAELEAEANEALTRDGLAAKLESKRYRLKADDLKSHYELELKQLDTSARTAAAQVAVQDAEIAKLRASLEIKRKKVAGLRIRAGTDGVLQQIGDKEQLQIGQRVGTSTTLAKIVQPAQLKAEIKIAETQVKDVLIGQVAAIDTRNGIIPGKVVRVDPAVQDGTVTVDVKLEGPLPKGARPDLSVDGTIELERLENVLFVGRPVHGQSDSTTKLFKMMEDGKEAVRVPVQFGRVSVSTIEVISGLGEGSEVILSDMSQWDAYDKVRLN